MYCQMISHRNLQLTLFDDRQYRRLWRGTPERSQMQEAAPYPTKSLLGNKLATAFVLGASSYTVPAFRVGKSVILLSAPVLDVPTPKKTVVERDIVRFRPRSRRDLMHSNRKVGRRKLVLVVRARIINASGSIVNVSGPTWRAATSALADTAKTSLKAKLRECLYVISIIYSD